MANTIGIDFGTTKTMVSYFNPATGRVELVRLGRDRDSIPTTVHVDESGAFLFGEDADDQIETDPEGYCRAFKLHLGERDPVLLRTDETAESLAARFLRHIKSECEQSVFHGESVTAATITVPVAFAPARKAALKRAAEAAGFSSISFLPEPEAAGTAFLRDNPADKFSRALVLDWGGGTLDIAIISRDEDGTIHADRHCAEGRDDMGGEEMDRGLLMNLDHFWNESFGSSLTLSEENEPKMLREAEKVKIGLSRKASVSFRRGKDKIDITKEEFHQIVEALLQAAVELVQSSLSKNKAQGNPDPDTILLIGGTSQSPVVRESMKKAFPNLRVLSWHHSHEAVALGALDVIPSRSKKPASSSATLDKVNSPAPPPLPTSHVIPLQPAKEPSSSPKPLFLKPVSDSASSHVEDGTWVAEVYTPNPVRGLPQTRTGQGPGGTVEDGTGISSGRKTRVSRASNLAESLASAMVSKYRAEEFGVQKMLFEQDGRSGILVQIKNSTSNSGGFFKTITGLSSCATLKLLPDGDDLLVEVMAGKWIDKIGAAVVSWFILWPLLLTAAFGAYRQKAFLDSVYANAIEWLMSNRP